MVKTWANELVTVALHDQEPGGSQTKKQVKISNKYIPNMKSRVEQHQHDQNLGED